MAGQRTKLIVVGIDGSDQCENAFHFYIENLHNDGNRMLLLHCAEPPMVASQQAMYMTGEVWEELLEKEKTRVKQLEAKFADIMRAKGVSGKIKAIFTSNPGDVIVETASDEKAAMIVMGTRGLGKLRRTILGSVSDFVLHHAHCPVVICRQ